MIRVFPSRLEGEPLEVHQTQIEMTVRGWLAENAPNLDLTEPTITLHINGQGAGLDDTFGPDDVLDIHIEPRGGWVVVAVVAAVAVAAIMMLMPKPAAPRSQAQGKGLDAAGLDANVVRMGDPIPEIFGTPPRVYPDYIVPPRTHYIAERTQVVDALLCVGKGKFQKSLSSVYIGDTQASSLGGDVEMQFFEPGASLVGVEQAQVWHSPQEVGFTSRGGSGLELGFGSLLPVYAEGGEFSVSGATVTISGIIGYSNVYDEDGHVIDTVPIYATFPSGWTTGISLHIEVPFPATVVNANTISSPQAMAHFTPQIGDVLAVSGAGDDDDYVVSNFTPATGATPYDPGTASSFTGDDVPANLDYSAAPGTLTITQGGQTFHVYLSLDYATAGELAAAIAAQLNSTGITAALTLEGYVQLLEQQPYSGDAIVVEPSAAATDIFGTDPVSVTGTAEQPASPGTDATITLVGAQFIPGAAEVAIGPAGHRYEITSAPNAMTRVVTAPDVTGFTGWPALDSPDIVVYLHDVSQQVGWTGPFTVTPPCAEADAVEIDYVFPSGLIRYNMEKGKPRTHSATVYLQWREVGTTEWTSVNYRHSRMQRNAIGFTQRIDLPRPMAVEVRMRRSPRRENDPAHYDEIQWTGLRARLVDMPTSYEGVTLLAVRIRSGDRVSVQSENKIWLRGITRILPTVEDPEVEEATRDIVPASLYILGSVGYGRDRVDMIAAQELHEIWKERGDTWDYSAKDSSTVKTLVNHCLKAGFAELTLDRGLIKFVRDALRDMPQYIYSPQEFTDYPTLTTKMIEPDDVDGIDAEYVDSGTGRVETVRYRLPGDIGRRVQKISLIGITDPVRAWRLAARHRRTLAYRRTTFKGETELQALNSSYMSYDRIQDGIPGYGQSAFVVSVRGQTLRLSEALDWNQSGAVVLAFRQMDGRLTRPYGVTRGIDDYHAVLSDPIPLPIHLGGDGRDPTMVYFGKINNWSHGVLVTSIAPGRNGRVTLEAVEYDQRVYVEDDRDPRGVTFLTTDVYPTPDVWHYLSMRPESINVDIGLISGSHKTKDEIFMEDESIDVGIALISGRHQGTTTHELEAVPGGEAIDVGIALISGDSQSAIEYENPSESIDVNISLIEGNHEQG